MFPIPMRGNEDWTPRGCLQARLSRFPIPMRGNELVTPLRPATRPSAFPIPMRGNEQECLGARLGHFNRVSNPHEG